SLAPGQVAVVPLDLARLAEPAAQGRHVDVPGLAVEHRGVPELAAGHVEPGLAEIGPAPEHQADALLLPAVTDDGVALQEPDRMAVPDPVLRAGQVAVDLARQQVAEFALAGVERRVVARGVRMHGRASSPVMAAASLQ